MIFAAVLVVFTLSACEEEVPPIVDEGDIVIIDFIGMSYSDVVDWGRQNKISIKPSSDYRDDLEPGEVYDQSVTPGTKLDNWDEVIVYYSRGYDPDGSIVVPDFTGMTQQDIRDWLEDQDIGKYRFYETFSNEAVGAYVRYDVEQLDTTQTEYLRKDQFNFYFSKGGLEVETVEFDEIGTVRGVNLGGWFVLESWMTPDLFSGIPNAHDETTWIINNPNAEEDLIEHWETFITEADFQFLADNNIEYIRLPIPWWMWGGVAYETTPFPNNTLPWWDESAGTNRYLDYRVEYIASVDYIDQAMTWAEEYGIKVLVDLHAAPGGQNGFDNGGLSGVNVWANQQYVTQTLLIVRDMVQHFNQFDSFWGFQVMNEPGWGVPLDTLMEYYADSYNIIRAYNQDVWVGFHDGFRSYMENEWTEFFQDPEHDFEKVFFDIHLYHVFGDWKKSNGENFTIYDHLEWVHVEDYKAVHRYDGIVPVIIGEWSGGLPVVLYEGLDPEMHDQLKLAFVNAQLNVFEEGMGHFFWSYKIDQGTHMEWDIVRMIEAGLFPTDWSTQGEAE